MGAFTVFNMSLIYPLFSSSSGNSCFIGSSEAGILIDAGTSCRRLVSALKTCGIEPEAVKAVFITHDHSDHIGALKIFTKNYPVPVYGSKGTVTYLENAGIIADGPRNVVDEKGSEVAGFYVRAFHTPHDAMESVFYKINTPDGKTACVCTDLGYVPDEIDAELLGSDLVLLESNYDENMLKTGPYPYSLKVRIASELGHLSNTDSAREVRRLIQNGTTRIILGHLSRHNNTPSVAERTLLKTLGSEFVRNRDYILNIAPVETCGMGMSF